MLGANILTLTATDTVLGLAMGGCKIEIIYQLTGRIIRNSPFCTVIYIRKNNQEWQCVPDIPPRNSDK